MVATANDDNSKTCLKIVNAEADDVSLRIKSGRLMGHTDWLIITGELKDANTMEMPERISAKKMPVSYDGQDTLVIIPAYSASVISWTTAAQ